MFQGHIKRLKSAVDVTSTLRVNPYPAKLTYLHFQPLEVVSRYRDPQPQVVENDSYFFNFRSHIYNFSCLNGPFTPKWLNRLIKRIKNGCLCDYSTPRVNVIVICYSGTSLRGWHRLPGRRFPGEPYGFSLHAGGHQDAEARGMRPGQVSDIVNACDL